MASASLSALTMKLPERSTDDKMSTSVVPWIVVGLPEVVVKATDGIKINANLIYTGQNAMSMHQPFRVPLLSLNPFFVYFFSLKAASDPLVWLEFLSFVSLSGYTHIIALSLEQLH